MNSFWKDQVIEVMFVTKHHQFCVFRTCPFHNPTPFNHVNHGDHVFWCLLIRNEIM
jgi:hypothetical protein